MNRFIPPDRKKNLSSSFKLQNKFKTLIVRGKIFKIDALNLYVRFDGKMGVCPLKNLSDFKNRTGYLARLNCEYQFLVVDFICEPLEITRHLVADCY